MPLLAPPAAQYHSRDELLASARAWAASQGYAVTIARSKPNKIYLKCDKGGTYRNKASLTDDTRQRRSSSKLTGCPFVAVGTGKDGVWSFYTREAAHNHEAADQTTGVAVAAAAGGGGGGGVLGKRGRGDNSGAAATQLKRDKTRATTVQATPPTQAQAQVPSGQFPVPAPAPVSARPPQSTPMMTMPPTTAVANLTGLPPWKVSFLQSCLDNAILQFGTFMLKSGRVSPYFFNAGLFHRADLLRSIAAAYAETIRAATTATPTATPGDGRAASSAPPLAFDVLFGPAYKGIPLATATTQRLAELDPARFAGVSYAFNRKEAKDHGEGGSIVGCPLAGRRVVVVDDVITAGTAMREAIDIINGEGGTLVGIVVALDRMEKMPSPEGYESIPMPSAIGQLRRQYGVPVLSILTLDDIIHGLSGHGSAEDLRRLNEYRELYRPLE